MTQKEKLLIQISEIIYVEIEQVEKIDHDKNQLTITMINGESFILTLA